MTTFGDSLGAIAAAMRGDDDPFDDAFAVAARTCAQLEAEAERQYQARLATWERNAPQREMAERAAQAAFERRHAELGAAGAQPVRVAAALEWTRPRRMSLEG